jgi:hypothetical protein
MIGTRHINRSVKPYDKISISSIPRLLATMSEYSNHSTTTRKTDNAFYSRLSE